MTLLKKPSSWIAALMMAVFAIACGTNTAEEQRDKMNDKLNDAAENMQENAADLNQQMEKDRQALAKDLRDIRDQITTKLDKENEKLAGTDLKADERAECERMRTELEREKAEVENTLATVEKADASSWAAVQLSARKSLDDVNAWMRTEMEKVDRKTKADADKDGH